VSALRLLTDSEEERALYEERVQAGAMQRASGVIRGTHTGETYLHATGDGTGAVGTFNRNAKALKGALLDSTAHYFGISLEAASDLLNLLIGGDDTIGSATEVLPLDEILEHVKTRWGVSFRRVIKPRHFRQFRQSWGTLCDQ